MRARKATRRTVLIVSPSEIRRRDWSAVISSARTDVLTCPGPSIWCALFRGMRTCPLVARSDLALYDADATSTGFLATLLAAHRTVEVVVARNRVVRGQHRPRGILRRAAAVST